MFDRMDVLDEDTPVISSTHDDTNSYHKQELVINIYNLRKLQYLDVVTTNSEPFALPSLVRFCEYPVPFFVSTLHLCHIADIVTC